ncbi:MAG: LytTR family DNA-binding domain-containing protein [Anaerostipes sp.]|nr:LytTR family DNA-binding domain-containing protein [Anaerostipes sp.]
MIWKIAICDDEKIYNDKIYQLCQNRLYKEGIDGDIVQFQSGKEFLASDIKFHMLFLDVEMEDMDGFDVGKQLIKEGCKTSIIYITSHDEWVQRAFEVKAYRYIYKTQMDMIPEVMMDVIHDLSENIGLVIKVREADNHRMVLYLSEIYAMESIGDETVIILENGNVLTRETVKDLVSRLNENFIVCSRGKAINLEYVKRIDRGCILLQNETQYRISRRKEKEVRERFDDFIKKHLRYQ